MTGGGTPGGFAVIGIGCRFPGGADTPERFWRSLADGTDAIAEVPRDRFDVDELFDPDPAAPGRMYTRWGGFLDAVDGFDAAFFGISPREARRIDPQHRLLLELVWEALEDAGQPVDRLAGTATGVFVGISTRDYLDIAIEPRNRELLDAHAMAGGAPSLAANRISYQFDFRGLSVAVDTACSSSLTAVHLACRALAAGDCDLAVAGGVNLILTPEPMLAGCKATMLSPDGRCRPFDARANGYVRAEGAGVVVLKPLIAALADGDPVRSVVLGTATNQDGRTTGITVPSAAAQEDLLRTAVAAAGVAPADIDYVEAHGTGTPVGDPREAAALGRVFGAAHRPDRPCLVGSVKSNIGHLEAGAGIAGLIKTTLALQHRTIPPTLHLESPNPAIDLAGLGLRVPTTVEPWPAHDRPALAGVNSFGFGGANAHAVIQEAPAPRDPIPDDRAQLMVLSARSPEALRALAQAHADRAAVGDTPPLSDVSYTAAARRSRHEHRLAVISSSAEELANRLTAHLDGTADAGVYAGRAGAPEPVVFVCTGMGPQWWGMARGLLRDEPVFAEVIGDCDRLLAPIAGWSLLDQLAEPEERSRVAEADLAHVANLAVQVGLAALWRSWGIVPNAVVGHSSGEMGAACVAGALALPDALRLAYHRGRLQQRTAGTGGMLAAGIPAGEAASLVSRFAGRVTLAAVNGPASVTLSGEPDELAAIGAELARQGLFQRMLPVRVPYHGPQQDVIRDELLHELAGLAVRPPEIPMVSTVTGDWVNGKALDADHWWRSVRDPVLFARAVDLLAAEGHRLFIELGPHPVLAPSIVDCIATNGLQATVLASLRRDEDDRTVMLRSLGRLYVGGHPIEWDGVFGPGRRCVPLPAYPWQRERYWQDTAPPAAAGVDSGNPLLGRRLRASRPTWETDVTGPRLAYLADHVVSGAPTFPAAGHVELALAAAGALGGGTRVALRDVAFHRLLTLREQGVLQCEADERAGTVEIRSGPAEGEASWTLRASARIAEPGDRDESVDVAALRARVPDELPVDELYQAIEDEFGFRYQGSFRGIERIWHGHGEALAVVSVPGSTAGYQVHPALLDAAFQTLIATLPTGGAAGPMLPVALERVELYRAAGDRVLVHAVRGDGAAIEGSVLLLTESGEPVLRCDRLRLAAIEPRTASDLVHAERWHLAPRTGPRARRAEPVPAPTAIADGVAAVLGERARHEDLGRYYTTADAALNARAAGLIRAGLTELGWDAGGDRAVPAEELVDRLGVITRHHRYFARMLAIAERAGEPPPVQSDLEGYGLLVERAGERLAATLRGEQEATRWMFDGPMLDKMFEFYGTSWANRVYNPAVAQALAAVRQACPTRLLRILEIGAGTGGTTSHVLPMLPPGSVDYLYTDVSAFFLNHARARFASRSDVRFAPLDIERPPSDELGTFDVVLAADVLHATADVRAALRNIRSLLEPGGLLVLLELSRRSPWLDLVLGALDGWWRGTGTELRPAHPLLSHTQWRRVLAEQGFIGATALHDPCPAGEEPAQAVLLAAEPVRPDTPALLERRHWLVCADGRGVADQIARQLRVRGDRCTIVASGEPWSRVLSEATEAAGSPDGLLHLSSVDAPAAPKMSGASLMAAQEAGCGSVTELMRGLHQAGIALSEAWLVTSGAQQVSDSEGLPGVAQAPMWGLGRVLRTEQPGMRCHLVDLGPECSPDELDGLLDELDAETAADELALRGRLRFVRRIERTTLGKPRTRLRAPDTDGFRLEIGTPGSLEDLALNPVPSRPLGPGEVAIRPAAAGLNFRDVLTALGLLTPAAPLWGSLGGECSGVVQACGESVSEFRPGDEVLAPVMWGLGSRVVVPCEVVVRKPPELTFEQAATLPVAFLTARYALHDLARLAEGERVLIHSASGGVGLAAVQLAVRAGAEILATAGTPEKRDYLRSLGIKHVLDSRSPDWAGEVMRATGGEGVDVVLNSLAGDAIRSGLEVLRHHGRFIELGRRDIDADNTIGLLPFEKSLTLASMHTFQLGTDRPALVGTMLRQIVDEVAAGELKPLPYTAFDLAEAEQAFRYFAQARHIGKVVMTVRERGYQVIERRADALFRPDGSYLITGGLGGFGLAVAHWMVRRGARDLVLVSRSGTPRPEDRDALHELRTSPARVHVRRADVAEAGALARLLDDVRASMPPLRGVLHAAMVLDDDLLGRLDYPRVRAALSPKLAGAWRLHELTADDDLDLFVLFSSGSSLLGLPGQAGYAAGNAGLDALASYRRSLGLPAVSINWGAIAGAGYVSQHPEVRHWLARNGVHPISVDDACAALGEILRRDIGRIGVARIDWAMWTPGVTGGAAASPGGGAVTTDLLPALAGASAAKRLGLLERYMVATAAKVLDTPVDRVSPGTPLTDVGLDSLLAVELRTRIRQDLGVVVEMVDLLDAVSPRALAERMARKLDDDGPGR